MNQKTPFDLLNVTHTAGFDNTANNSDVLNNELDVQSVSNDSIDMFIVNNYMQKLGFTPDQVMMPQTSNGSNITQEEIGFHAILNNNQVQHDFNVKQEELKYASVPVLLDQFQQDYMWDMPSTSMASASMPAQVAPSNQAFSFFDAPPTLYPVQAQPVVGISPHTPPQMAPQMPVQQFNQLPLVLPLPMCPPAVAGGFLGAMAPPGPNGTTTTCDPGFAPSTSKPVKPNRKSVASQVSLQNCEPRLMYERGIKYVAFHYTKNRQGKPFYIRADVESVDVDAVPIDIRNQNTIYREALNRETYKGQRFKYESECNILGWKLCYLNRELLFGKKGLTQRSIDAYRAVHDATKSRRILRWQKIMDGTLRKRSPKKMKGDKMEKK